MKSLALFSSLLSLSAAFPVTNPLELSSLFSLEKLQDRQSCSLIPTNPSTFWYESITHNGVSPFINDPTWQVYRNVQDFGAVGDGVTDDTSTIQNAINQGNSENSRTTFSFGTTGQPAVVYLPSGTYMISEPLQVHCFPWPENADATKYQADIVTS